MSNWAAIGALGTAAEGAGNYFGIIAKEKIVSQRLADARANKVADTEDAREYQEQTAETNRVQGLEDQEAAREQSIKDNLVTTAAANAENDRRKGVTAEIADRGGDEGEKWTKVSNSDMKVDADGNEYILMDNGSGTTEYKQVGMGDVPFVDAETEGGDKSEFEAKAAYQKSGAQAGLNDMYRAMEAGYDPTTLSSYIDGKVVKSDELNFIASAEGQVYQRGATQLYENLLRRATGAAAPDTEVMRYYQMFVPKAGDSEEVAQAKMLAAGKMIESLDGMSNTDVNSPEWELEWKNKARAITQEAQLDPLDASLGEDTVSAVPGTVPPTVRNGASRAGNGSSAEPSQVTSKYY